MGNNGLLIFPLAIPAVQLDATTSGEQRLAVHLDGALAANLATRQIRIMRTIDIVMGQRLIHFHIEIKPIQKYGRILIGH